MRKKLSSRSKNLGHFSALGFYIILGYFFYLASSNMNYTWRWSGVPKYFAYEQTFDIQAPIDGKLIKFKNHFYIQGKNTDNRGNEKVTKIKLKNLDSSYKLEFKSGDAVYEGDSIAMKTTLKAGPIIWGLWTTVEVSFFGALIAFFIANIVAFMKLSSSYFLKDVATVYITIIRGTPLLVQIFLFYFLVANIFELKTTVAGILALGIFYGAYISEVLRGAIQSIDKGQSEASLSLGISKFQNMRHIILPQAFKRALPTLVGEVIALLKDSSLISVISITDLTKVGREIIASTFSPFETWIVIALLYLCLTSILSFIGHLLEKRMLKKGGIN